MHFHLVCTSSKRNTATWQQETQPSKHCERPEFICSSIAMLLFFWQQIGVLVDASLGTNLVAVYGIEAAVLAPLHIPPLMPAGFGTSLQNFMKVDFDLHLPYWSRPSIACNSHRTRQQSLVSIARLFISVCINHAVDTLWFAPAVSAPKHLRSHIYLQAMYKVVIRCTDIFSMMFLHPQFDDVQVHSHLKRAGCSWCKQTIAFNCTASKVDARARRYECSMFQRCIKTLDFEAG